MTTHGFPWLQIKEGLKPWKKTTEYPLFTIRTSKDRADVVLGNQDFLKLNSEKKIEPIGLVAISANAVVETA